VAAPVRLGLVGAGSWGRNYIKTIAGLADVRLARLASRNPESAKIVPRGCVIVADWRDLIDPELVDGVIIATLPQSHAEIAIAALDRRLPVLIEKPLTTNIDEARAIRVKALERHLPAMVDHTQLFHPAYRKLKSLLPQLGAIQEIRSEAGRIGPFRPDTPVLWDWGCHDVAMCLDVTQQRPTRARAKIVERQQVGSDQGESVLLELEFGAGIGATISVSNILVTKTRRFTVTCERGTAVYDEFGADQLVVQDGPVKRPIGVERDLPLTVAVREFATAVSSSRFDPKSIELGVGVVEALSACASDLARS
jgi:predicted dehydrogenase